MDQRIVYTRHNDGGVSICCPSDWIISVMSCGGLWDDHPPGFADVQIARMVADGIREDAAARYAKAVQRGGCTTAEALARLKGVVKPEGTVTPGNASGVNDGACALVLADEATAIRHGLTPLARVIGVATAGCEPRIMGIGPVPATRKLLARTGIKLEQVDVIELNEAFAAQGLAVLRQLGIADDDPRVNPNGGAIALGHPLGMSGARLVATATHELQERRLRYALATMCIGVGQGISMLLERA